LRAVRLPLERVGRRVDLPAAVIAIETGPVDLDAAHVNVANAVEQLPPVAAGFPHRRDAHGVVGKMTLGESRENRCRPDLDEQAAAAVVCGIERGGEPNSLAKMT
jgi:hypothetical protein